MLHIYWKEKKKKKIHRERETDFVSAGCVVSLRGFRSIQDTDNVQCMKLSLAVINLRGYDGTRRDSTHLFLFARIAAGCVFLRCQACVSQTRTRAVGQLRCANLIYCKFAHKHTATKKKKKTREDKGSQALTCTPQHEQLDAKRQLSEH